MTTVVDPPWPVKIGQKRWPPRAMAYISCSWPPLPKVSGSATGRPTLLAHFINHIKIPNFGVK